MGLESIVSSAKDFVEGGMDFIKGGSSGGTSSGGYINAGLDFAANRYSARHANTFSRKMASTQYSRAVNDLRRAGLNPILAARLGGNAAPMGAAMAPSNFANAVSSAKSADAAFKQAETAEKRQQVDADMVYEQIDALQITKRLTQAQVYKVAREADKILEDTDLVYLMQDKQAMENAVNKVITDFKQEHPTLTLLQEFGLDAGELSAVLRGLLTRKGKTTINSTTNNNNSGTRNTTVNNN